MTNGQKDDLDQRLEILGEAISQLRTQQEANTASIATLQSLTSELLDIARLHQQALRVSQTNIIQMQTEFRENQGEIRRIWEYLLGQQRNNGGGQS